jgi:hypothetical protein
MISSIVIKVRFLKKTNRDACLKQAVSQAVQSLDFSRQKDSSEMVDNNGRNLLFLSQAIENIVI